MKHLRAWREPTARTLLCVAALVAAGSLARPAEAQSSPGRVAAGHRLAETFCAQCHVIIRGGPAGWTDAPSFPAVADRTGYNIRMVAALHPEAPRGHVKSTPEPVGCCRPCRLYPEPEAAVVSFRTHPARRQRDGKRGRPAARGPHRRWRLHPKQDVTIGHGHAFSRSRRSPRWPRGWPRRPSGPGLPATGLRSRAPDGRMTGRRRTGRRTAVRCRPPPELD